MFIRPELLLPTHAFSTGTTNSLSTRTICYEVFAQCLAQKAPPVIASFLYSRESASGHCTIFNAAHPRETYNLIQGKSSLYFFLCFLNNKTSCYKLFAVTTKQAAGCKEYYLVYHQTSGVQASCTIPNIIPREVKWKAGLCFQP